MDHEALFYKKAFLALRHDTRNLEGGLAVVRGYLQDQNDPTAERYAQYLDDRMTAILALGKRAEALASVTQVRIETVALCEIVDAVLVELGEEAQRVSTALADATLLADQELAVAALMELLKNALEAGSEVSVSVNAEDSWLEIHVSDDGEGVPELAEAHLFTPFQGARHPRGAGLGLPLAKVMMEAQGGTCRLAETGPAGSTFALRFQVKSG